MRTDFLRYALAVTQALLVTHFNLYALPGRMAGIRRAGSTRCIL
jgi:hypothetical protein